MFTRNKTQLQSISGLSILIVNEKNPFRILWIFANAKFLNTDSTPNVAKVEESKRSGTGDLMKDVIEI